jgi:hypothetical protein
LNGSYRYPTKFLLPGEVRAALAAGGADKARFKAGQPDMFGPLFAAQLDQYAHLKSLP